MNGISVYHSEQSGRQESNWGGAIGVNYVENYDWGGERSKYNQTGNQEESKGAIKVIKVTD